MDQQERQKWIAEIDATGAQRETMFRARQIPAGYAAAPQRVAHFVQTLAVPEAGVPVDCHVFAAPGRAPGCPVHVNAHGGGFYFGRGEDDDRYCAALAEAIGGIVVDVDYALSAQYAFPAAFEQCCAAVRWAFGQCGAWGADEKRVSMGGQSAGGTLTAAVALRAAATREFALCLQVLTYAALDNATDPLRTPSGAEMPEAMVRRCRAFSALYAGGDRNALLSPFASPALADDGMLDGAPPALVITGGLCPFRFCDEAYALRLAARGAPVTVRRFTQSRHGFTVRLMDEWQASQALIARAVREASL